MSLFHTKQTVIPLLDQLTPIARQAGAVNTIWLKNGLLTGDNTDIPGFKTDFETKFGLQHEVILVLGAGGAARAVLQALDSEKTHHPCSCPKYDKSKKNARCNFNSTRENSGVGIER